MSMMYPNMHFTVNGDTALIVVDVQNTFCPGGGLAVAGGNEIVPAINWLMAMFNKVALSQDWHPADHKSFASQHKGKNPYDTIPLGSVENQMLWTDHGIQNTEDAALRPDLDIRPAAGEFTTSKGNGCLIQKGTNRDVDSYSAFFENDKVSQPKLPNGQTLDQWLKAQGVKKIVVAGLAYDFCVGFTALDGKALGFDVVVVKDACRSVAVPVGEGVTTETLMDSRLKDAGVTVTTLNDLPRVLGATPKAGAPKPLALAA